MTPFLTLTACAICFTFIHWLNRIIKRVFIKLVAPSGVTGPEILIEKTRWQVWMEKVRPWSWGVVCGAVMWPVIGWWIG